MAWGPWRWHESLSGEGNPEKGYVFRHSGYSMKLGKHHVGMVGGLDVLGKWTAYIFLGTHQEKEFKSELAAVHWVERKIWKWLMASHLIKKADLTLTLELERQELKALYSADDFPQGKAQ